MDRVASDAVETARGTVARHGGPRSRRLRLPEDEDETTAVDIGVDAGECLRVSLAEPDGTTTDGYARVDADAKGRYLGGVFANRRLARTEGEGTDLLAAWLDAVDIGPGESVAVDVLDPGHQLGLRRPGDRVVYAVPDRRDDSLADIAERLDGDG